MNCELSEEQEMLKTMARDFLEKECPESFVREMEEDDDGLSLEMWHKVADLGWLGLVYPEEYGGTEGNILDLAVLHEEMGRAMLPSPYLSTVVLCGLTILNAGSEEQKADLLPKIVSGDLILSLALTEPEFSWDSRAWEPEGITARATPDGDDYIIDGSKLFVHDAHIADYLLCVARTKDEGKPEEGITLFLVDATSPGINITLLRTFTGDKQSEVIFDKVRIPKKNMVEELNGGWSPLSRVLQVGAVMLCAEMVGAGQRMVELTVDYAKTRIAFDLPIGVNQYVQEHCVSALGDVEGSRWVTFQAAWKLSEGLPCDFEVALAKAWTSEANERYCCRCHQVFSGVGTLLDDGVLPLYTRRGKSKQLYLGDASYHLKKVADEVVKWPPLEKPKGKPLGIFDVNLLEEEQVPAWEPWRERYEKIEQRKAERRAKKSQSK
jgi:alkylation response protein AidB-like acyl-CoA dehydrogenase